MLNNASKSAITPTAIANSVTISEFLGITPSSISLRNNRGVATIKKASTTTVTKNSDSDNLYGKAKAAMRLRVPGFNF